jgi:hypothetical protein
LKTLHDAVYSKGSIQKSRPATPSALFPTLRSLLHP